MNITWYLLFWNTAHYVHRIHCTLHMKYCTLHRIHCTLHTKLCTLHMKHCTLHIKHFTVHMKHYALHRIHCIQLRKHCTCQRIHYILHFAQWKVAQGIIHTAECIRSASPNISSIFIYSVSPNSTLILLTDWLLTDWVSHPLWKYLQNTFTSKL